MPSFSLVVEKREMECSAGAYPRAAGFVYRYDLSLSLSRFCFVERVLDSLFIIPCESVRQRRCAATVWSGPFVRSGIKRE